MVKIRYTPVPYINNKKGGFLVSRHKRLLFLNPFLSCRNTRINPKQLFCPSHLQDLFSLHDGDPPDGHLLVVHEEDVDGDLGQRLSPRLQLRPQEKPVERGPMEDAGVLAQQLQVALQLQPALFQLEKVKVIMYLHIQYVHKYIQ